MSFLSNLAHIDGKRGIFSILLTATALTVFEIIFFYKIVAPSVDKAMNKQLEKLAEKTANDINLKSQGNPEFNRLFFNDNIRALVNTFAKREENLVKKINFYTKATGALIIGLLMLVLYSLYGSIGRESSSLFVPMGLGVPTVTALFTVAALIGFQILFYFFGKQFKYPGTFGNEELFNVLLSSLN